MLEKRHLKALRAATIPEVGNRVAFAIELAEKRQGEVAADLGMPQSQLSDICRGRFPDPKLSTLQKLSDYFGCQIEDLFPLRAA
jgi:transcriptional regulator with XRE-family HTH domain